MRANRKEPGSAPFSFQSLSVFCRPHGGLLLDRIAVLSNDQLV
jgi:hypothetical protein